jgi:hypothetical protein
MLQPRRLAFGLALIAVAWPLAWFGPSPWSEYTFFPLWLGYILVVDGLTFRRAGTSLFSRDRRRFALLFAFSIPLWWVFEFANQYLHNWEYILPRDYGPVMYGALASLAFSTVMPAILVTAEYFRTFRLFAPARRWIRIAPSTHGLVLIGVLGLAMFVASLVFPDVAFPLVWIGLFLLVDAVNCLTGGKSIAANIAVGRWDTVLVLFVAGIVCGFFWEMWNEWSMPKWVYDVPHVEGPKLFEMPWLGYGGYFPFALEVYAFYHLCCTIVFRRRDAWLRFDQPSKA